jgi:hypothetical protein
MKPTAPDDQKTYFASLVVTPAESTQTLVKSRLSEISSGYIVPDRRSNIR